MIKGISRISGFALVTLALLAGRAHGQEPVRISLGTGFGATLPVGDAADNLDLGWHAQANLGLSKASWPVGLRFDFVYHSLNAAEGVVDRDLRILSGLVNLEFRLNRAGGPGGFFIAGGPGIYNFDAEGVDGQTEFGIFGGVGYKIAMTNLLVSLEGKFHNVFTELNSTQLIPFSIVVELPLGR